MASSHEIDENMILRAIQVARGNPSAPFGSVIFGVDDSQVIAEGLNDSKNNPLLHGEIVALNELAALKGAPASARLCLYTTAEPCPMCLAAIMWAGIPRIVYGTTVATLVAKGWKQFQLPSRDLIGSFTGGCCELIGPVLEAKCDSLFPTRS